VLIHTLPAIADSRPGARTAAQPAGRSRHGRKRWRRSRSL